jgi:hypothetical protein
VAAFCDRNVSYNQTLPYDFILGWSTGHVGTTTLSHRDIYKNIENKVQFMFESNKGVNQIAWLSRQQWLSMNRSSIYDFVKDSYIPYLLQSRGSMGTLVDLGHHNVFFIDELLSYIFKETSYRVLIVRIRRERYENALSLTHTVPNRPILTDVCNLTFGYCPYQKEEDVILKIPRNDFQEDHKVIWDGLRSFQQALWMIDETELRWQRILQRYPSLNHMELTWGKKWSNSFVNAAAALAAAMNITVRKDKAKSMIIQRHSPLNPSLTHDKCLKYDLDYHHIILQPYMKVPYKLSFTTKYPPNDIEDERIKSS